MPPYMAEQIGAALRLARTMDREREKLLGSAQRFASSLGSRGWDTRRNSMQVVSTQTVPTQIVPLIIGENERALSAAEYLQSQGFAVRAVRPPTVPHGSARLRFSLTSGIPDDELLRLENALNNWRENKCWSAAVARA